LIALSPDTAIAGLEQPGIVEVPKVVDPK
jgi:hypothetical protein